MMDLIQRHHPFNVFHISCFTEFKHTDNVAVGSAKDRIWEFSMFSPMVEHPPLYYYIIDRHRHTQGSSLLVH